MIVISHWLTFTQAVWLVLLLGFSIGESKEYPPYNGFYNNRGNPGAGAIDSALTRRLPARYEDGVYAPSGRSRPNPRLLSSRITSGSPGLASVDGKTALFYFFGEHVLQEIVDVERPGCPPEYFNIPVPANDSSFDINSTGSIEIPYQRSRYDASNTGYSPNHPRDQLNEVTSFLDGSAIYGKERAWTNQLRLFRETCQNRPSSNIFANEFGNTACSGELTSFLDEGKLPSLNTRGLPLHNPVPPTHARPLSANRFNQVGGRNLNENPFVMAIGVVWFRHHNWLARTLSQRNSGWTEEQVFNEARIRNIATYQHIVIDEWLPTLLGNCTSFSNGSCEEITSYATYSPGTSVGISDVFQAAAKYYIRTLAPSGVFSRGKYERATNSCTFNTSDSNDPLRVCNTYWVTDEILQSTEVDELIMGMASQMAELEDHVITDDVINAYHGPLGFSRRDLVAMIIQQGRDHGLPDYNTARDELGLERRSSFREINPDLFDSNPQLLSTLREVYNGDTDNVDVFIGGLLETSGGHPGELFRYVLRDQFIRLRNGDRFWFENIKNGLLNSSEIDEIRSLSFRDVILRTNPNLNGSTDLQDFVFYWGKAGDSKLFCGQPFQINSANHSWSNTCTPLKTYDYFSGSEVTYALILALIGVFGLCTLLLMYLLGKYRIREELKHKRGVAKKRKKTIRQGGVNVTIATELQGDNKTHQVQVCFGAAKEITVKTGQGNRVLRTLRLEDSQYAHIFTSTSATTVAVRTKSATYDLVIKLSDEDSFDEFVLSLRSFFIEHNIEYHLEDVGSEHALLQIARTKAMRDKVLQKFFKTALAQSAKIAVDSRELASEGFRNRPQSAKLVDTTLSKEEFADYLKLKVDSLFVQQMFTIADADDDGSVSFREFLNIIVLFTKGSPKDKAKLMFDMYDLDRSGELSSDEFKTMLKSMIEMVNASVDADQLDHLVADMMASYGLGSKESLTLDDFQRIMGKYSSDLSQASLTLPGTSPPKSTAFEKPKPTSKEETAVSAQNASDTLNIATGIQGRYFKKRRTTRLQRARMSLKQPLKEESSSQTPLRRRHTKHASSVDVPVIKEQYTENRVKKWWIVFVKWNQHYANHIFLVTLYTLLTIGVFLQSWNAVASNFPSGLGRIGGGWPAVARASAAGLMFNFSTLLLTMCRNTITLLRETFLHRYIPFDAAISMHKIIAWMAFFFTCLHVVAHGINFYSISTQSASDILCLFRDYFFPTDYLPNFVFWIFQTITGVTGVILALIVIIMYVFASNFSRRLIFNWFRWTHKVGFVSLYFFSVLHGSGTLISSPRFYLYFLGFGILYTLDKLYSLGRKKVEISVVKAELLPSDVTHLEFKRPVNFSYQAGQWVRIACLAQSPSEYHPFTLSSAPHEDTLKLHIRAVGPWTRNLRKIYDPETLRESAYPKLYLDGPFGEGHQDWYKYEVSVLVGGGIGVTPFASILKDLINTTQTGGNVACKSVYFIWVTRDQKQYEWLTDIIQKVEEKDEKEVLRTHIFITQFPQKFDLRTTMLYICEQHFQKIAGKSLFTGLRAITHFGRPDFVHFLSSLAEEHSKVKNFGVFSCGPPPMTNSVDKACTKLNKYEGPTYSHHFENF